MTPRYEIKNDGIGLGGHMCPPGHPNHTHSIIEYAGPRSTREVGCYAVSAAATRTGVPAPIRAAARKLIADAHLVASELWIRSVYGYSAGTYHAESGEGDYSGLVYQYKHPGVAFPPERHNAVALIREYFPEHEPRLDLITNPAKGYGSNPCDKCGERVQYEARLDAFAKPIESPSLGPTKYETECSKGGAHEVA